MAMQFTKATKSQAKARIALSGPAGSGKTYTALLLATALAQRVALIDTEHGSASKYADEFAFDTLLLDEFNPNNYVAAIQAAEQAGYDVLVIDSASHEWSGKGGCLELSEKFAAKRGGNTWAGWADVTPLHNKFIEAVHSADLHVITTFRSKMDYIQTQDKNGKTVVKKVGLNPITRDGTEYEYDIVGEIDLDHNLVISKSRCKALADQVITKPGRDLAETIKHWLSDGAPTLTRPTPAAPRQEMQPAATGDAVDEFFGAPPERIIADWLASIEGCASLAELERVGAAMKGLEVSAQEHAELARAYVRRREALKGRAER